MKANPLLDDLRAAFPPAPICARGAFEERGRLYCDTHEYRAHMDGKTWEQLDPQFFARRSDGLSFLGVSYIAKVLPLYLHLMVVFRPTSPIPETLLSILTKPEPQDWPPHLFDIFAERFEKLVALLSPQQKNVIATVLMQFVASAPGGARRARPALDRYWSQFLDLSGGP